MIKELNEEDVVQTRAIFASFPHHFNKLGLIHLDSDIADYLSSKNHSKICFFVEKERGQVLGVISYKRRVNPYEFEIGWLAVRSDFQKKGIGKKLLFHLEEKVKSIGCEVLIANVPDDIGSISFYEKVGFVKSDELSSDNRIVYKKVLKTYKPTFKPREIIGWNECILIRHAQTDWNKRKIFRGRAEVELNRTGIRQAEKTSTLLADLPVEIIYTSPLKRAQVSAQILTRPHNVPVKVEQSLIDIDYGEWQGLSEENVKDTKLYSDWITKPESVRFPGGESLQDVEKRVVPFFKDVIKAHNLSIIVSHRVVIKILLLHIMGLPLSSFWSVRQDPCGITRVEFVEGKYIIHSLNETYHLYKPSKEPKEDF